MDIETNDLPDGWTIEPLCDLCDINPKHPKELPDDLEISFIPMASVDDVTGTIQEQKTKALKEVRRGYTHFAEGDVIFAKITPCMENGKSAIARGLKNNLACGSTEFHVFRSRGSVLPDYLHPFLRQISYRNDAAQSMTGAVGHKRVPKQYILDSKLPLPPLKEQHRIVTKIEALTARSRKAREALDAIPALLDQFRQSVLAAAFRGDLTADWREENPDVESGEELLERIRDERQNQWGLNEDRKEEIKKTSSQKSRKRKYPKPVEVDYDQKISKPENWLVVSADQVTYLITDGKHGDCKDEQNSGYFFLSVKDLYDGTLHYENARQIRKEDFLEVNYRTNLEEGDVLVTNAGTIGRVAVAKDSAKTYRTTFQKSVAVLKPVKTVILSEYLAFYIENCVTSLKKKSSGTAVKNLLLRDLRKFAVALPSLAEQRRIVNHIQASLSSIHIADSKHPILFEDLNQLDQSILAKAFRGELVPQDPNDEPATVLLQRIQAEREKRKSKTKRKTRAKKK